MDPVQRSSTDSPRCSRNPGSVWHCGRRECAEFRAAPRAGVKIA